MDFFISEKSTPSPNVIGTDEFKVIITDSYVELNLKIDKTDSYFVFYLIPHTENSVFVVSCWDDTFDNIIENSDDESCLENLFDTCPLIATLLSNGIKDKCSDGALIKLKDYDNGDNKWFLASIAENIKFDNINTILCDRTIETINLVKEESMLLLSELHKKKPKN